MKKIVLAGGTGFLGSSVANYFSKKNVEIVILSRQVHENRNNISYQAWDAKSAGEWSGALEGATAVINFNGKSVDCRYNEKNRKLIYDTRLDSTAALGMAIQKCKAPPKLWINVVSSTIYRHSMDKEMDEVDGEIGAGFSVDVCQKWEACFNQFSLPSTRKVLLRTAIVLGKDGGALKPMKALTKFGLGGYQGSGDQFVSWVHELDYARIIEFIIAHDHMNGVYNATSPSPTTNRKLMKTLRSVMGIPFGIPTPTWLLNFGAVIIQTEPELILKSRRVVPKRLIDAGFEFEFDDLESALTNLIR